MRSTPRFVAAGAIVALAALVATPFTAASAAPAAPSMWPVIDLVELTATFLAPAPSTASIDWLSDTSPAWVDVPWALTY